MKNKILVIVNVPALNEKFDIFIPTNERIGVIVKLLITTIAGLSDTNIAYLHNCTLINGNTAIPYDENTIIRDTDIMNATNLVLL